MFDIFGAKETKNVPKKNYVSDKNPTLTDGVYYRGKAFRAKRDNRDNYKAEISIYISGEW